jgi:hypothetical protein
VSATIKLRQRFVKQARSTSLHSGNPRITFGGHTPRRCGESSFWQCFYWDVENLWSRGRWPARPTVG